MRYDYWERTLCAPFFVLSIIKNGYCLPFSSVPPAFFARNNRSSLQHRDFVESEIANCLKKSYIIEVDAPPHCVNPLTVAEGKKLRLVLDLRHVNPYLTKRKFRYEDLDTVTEMLQSGDYFTMFDLVSAYYHINIHPDFYKFLGFHWTFADGTTRYFVYIVLVFGLSSAAYVFTKVMRPLIRHWRLHGLRVLFYLDDGFNIAPSSDSCQTNTSVILECLDAAGFLVNIEKSELDPTQVGIWLGFRIDTRKMMFFVPEKKTEKLKIRISTVCAQGHACSRSLSRITGSLASMERALGPLVALMTRRTNLVIASAPDLDSVFDIGPDCKSELTFWLNCIEERNGYPIKRNHLTSQLMFTDASDHAYGGYLLHRLGKPICQGNFTPTQASSSSTNRELLAVKFCLQSFAHLIEHEAIEIRTDNLSAVSIIQKGSQRPHLQKLAIEIFQICTKHDVSLHPVWIPREQNLYADSLSKLTDTDDWSIDDESFAFICQELGYPDFDRFADDANCKVAVFNSRFHCPNSHAVNAFSQDWSRARLNWICPPVKLICASLHHARFCRAKGIFLVPQWPASHFWTLLHNGKNFENFIKDYRIIDPYYYSRAENCQFRGFLSFHAIALLIDFT